MIQSANDAAVALAIHVAGSKEGFVAMMNEKAKLLGMKNTRFHSVHGLPPAKGQGVDVSTARDFGALCRYLSTKPEVFLYTSARVRDFRDGEFVMRTHNHLLEDYDGCDGFKTGYFVKAGFSIAATAKRSGVRIIAIVMGSKNRKVRDAKAIELLAKGFTMVPPTHEALVKLVTAGQPTEPAKQVPAVAAANGTPISSPAIHEEIEPTKQTSDGWGKFFAGLVLGFILYGALNYFLTQRKKKRNWRYR
jgi:D-alanyl-D-alanine carboxypeptidase (penicillin-binding protein 5/6)